MRYEVTIKCGVLHTHTTVSISASSEEEAVALVKATFQFSSVLHVREVKDA